MVTLMALILCDVSGVPRAGSCVTPDQGATIHITNKLSIIQPKSRSLFWLVAVAFCFSINSLLFFIPSISTGGIDHVTNCFATVFGNFVCDDAASAVLLPIQSATSSL
jgi:hypothetical protein